MIGQPLWKNLKILVEIDNQIKKLREDFEKEERLIQKNKTLLPMLQEKITKAEREFTEIKKQVDLEELVAKELKEKEEAKKKILDTIKNEKEYHAINKEIKLLTQKRLEQEDILIKAWHQHDILKNKIAEAKKSVDQEITEITENIKKQESILKEIEEKIKELEKEKSKAENNIPSEWLNKYKKMKESVPNPVVPVVEGSCSACFYSVIRQDLQRLKNSGVLLCRNCYRFLYYEPEEKPEEKVASK